MQEGETADTSRQSSCAACSILSVLTQWGATLVIKLKGEDGVEGGGGGGDTAGRGRAGGVRA